jgi:Putative transposase, YhgA-like
LEVAKSFIEEVFPKDMRDKMNLNALQLTSASFIDDMLKEHFADLVYETEYKGMKATVTLLFEHKSYQKSFPEWQLLRYMTNIWGEQQKQESEEEKENEDKTPSVVIPIIIHHGKTAWKKNSMRAYFGNPPAELLRFLPEFDYLVFSLNDFEDYQIANFKNDFLATAAMLLKHSRDEKEKFLQIEDFLIGKLKAFDTAHENGFIGSIAYYLQSASNLTKPDLTIIFTKVSNIVNNIAMTIADEIRLEERTITFENTTFNHVKGLWEDGQKAEYIANVFKLPINKVEEIISRIKKSLN